MGEEEEKKKFQGVYLKYNSTLARSIYLGFLKIPNNPYYIYKCENPDCGKGYSLGGLTIHHLLPQIISPSLMYETRNMKLICKECHKKVNNVKNKKKKIKKLICGKCERVIGKGIHKVKYMVMKEIYCSDCFNQYYGSKS
jgi:hypothetical protein